MSVIFVAALKLKFTKFHKFIELKVVELKIVDLKVVELKVVELKVIELKVINNSKAIINLLPSLITIFPKFCLNGEITLY